MSSPPSKKDIRGRWKEKPVPTESSRKSASHAICGTIRREKIFLNARQVGIYAARRSEIDLSDLWELRPNACAFPRVEKEYLAFFFVGKLTEMEPGFGGILEPKRGQATAVREWKNGDLILVPGIAFDAMGNRVGSGLGFYDRFLSTLPPGVHRWGVCFDEQVYREGLPREATDISLHRIFTPSRIYEASPPKPF